MKKVLLGIFLFFIVIGMAIAIWYIRQLEIEPPVPNDVSFPISSPRTDAPENVGTITIATLEGTAVGVRNFLEDPATVEDPVNPGYFYLGNQPVAPDEVDASSYHIQYIAETMYFNIVLLSEPIGSTRLEAEQYLMQMLGITQETMCALNYTVSVPNSVNSIYTSMNLGFSFCPGSVRLP